jgi:hypothetical protein
MLASDARDRPIIRDLALRIALAVALSAAMAIIQIHAWNECDVGLNATARLWSILLFDAPAVLVALTLALVAPWRVGWPRASWLFAPALAYAWWALVVTPAGYPDPICPGNVPSWWPDLIPS